METPEEMDRRIATAHVLQFATHIVRFTSLLMEPLGSGIIIPWGDKLAIATCSHVFKALKEYERVGCSYLDTTRPTIGTWRHIEIQPRRVQVVNFDDADVKSKLGLDPLKHRRDLTVLHHPILNVLKDYKAVPLDIESIAGFNFNEPSRYVLIGFPLEMGGKLASVELVLQDRTLNEVIFTIKHSKCLDLASLSGSSGGLIVEPSLQGYRGVAMLLGEWGAAECVVAGGVNRKDGYPSTVTALPLIEIKALIGRFLFLKDMERRTGLVCSAKLTDVKDN